MFHQGSIRLGRVLDLEIRLHRSWFLVFLLVAWSLAQGVFPQAYGYGALLSWTLGVAGSLLLFGSVLVHEIAHAVVARLFGVHTREITLFLLGGVAELQKDPPTPLAEFCIAGAGPLVSMGIGGVGLVAWGVAGGLSSLFSGAPPPPITALLGYLGSVNLALAVFNLIPGYPLDGGRLVRSVLWSATGSLRTATLWAARAGVGFGWLLLILGVLQAVAGNLGGLWLAIVGWFLRVAAQTSYQHVALKEVLSGLRVEDVMTRDLPLVDADLRIHEFVEQFLLRSGWPIYPVGRGGEFLGVIATDEVRRLPKDVWGVTSVWALTRDPEQKRMVSGELDAWAALTRMGEHGLNGLLVMRDGRLEGVVTRESLARLAQQQLRLQTR